MARVSLALAASQDVRKILKWTEEKFGKRAQERYRDLLLQALRDIEADPERPGSKEWPNILAIGTRTYHLSFSRSRTNGQAVKEPRHFILYRLRKDAGIEVGRILHDGRDLQRHLPQITSVTIRNAARFDDKSTRDGTNANPYQVKQVRKVILRNKLAKQS